MYRQTFRAVCLVIAVVAGIPAVAKDVEITFESNVVTAHVSPGARTAWFLVAQQPRGRGTTLVNGAELITDDDGDGIVRKTLQRAVVPTSIWMIVDLQTGKYEISAPPGAPLRRRQLPPAALRGRIGGQSARALRHEFVTVLMVARPGVGAWIAVVDDGSTTDADEQADGTISVALASLQAVAGTPPPPTDFDPGDIVVFADPLTLAVHDIRVVK